MTEDKKHQLDELSVTDILSYLGARASDMEEHIRRTGKQLTKAKEIIKELSDTYKYVIQFEEYADREIVKEAEQFLEEDTK